MENTQQETQAPASAQATPEPTAINESEKQFSWIVYILQALSLLVGITSIVAVIMNHVKSGSITDPVLQTHNRWQIRTFWYTVLWSILAVVVATFTLGILAFVIAVPMIWFIYRFVIGMIRLNDGKPMYEGKSN